MYLFGRFSSYIGPFIAPVLILFLFTRNNSVKAYRPRHPNSYFLAPAYSHSFSQIFFSSSLSVLPFAMLCSLLLPSPFPLIFTWWLLIIFDICLYGVWVSSKYLLLLLMFLLYLSSPIHFFFLLFAVLSHIFMHNK